MRHDLPPGALAGGASGRRVLAVLRAYPELTKVRLTALVVATTAVGFLMAGGGHHDGATLALTVLGTALAAAGSMALNQVMEVARDARMERTKNRPIPTGVLTARHGLVFGVVVATVGLAVLAAAANTLTALLGLTVVLVYTLVYTPLKSRSPLCTLAGAVCGAIPPMMGWTATGAPLAFGAWLLAGVLFLWQIPHFLALAWLYREDYARGGFRMLPVVDASGRVDGPDGGALLAGAAPGRRARGRRRHDGVAVRGRVSGFDRRPGRARSRARRQEDRRRRPPPVPGDARLPSAAARPDGGGPAQVTARVRGRAPAAGR